MAELEGCKSELEMKSIQGQIKQLRIWENLPREIDSIAAELKLAAETEKADARTTVRP